MHHIQSTILGNLFSKFLVEDRAVEPDAVCISAALSSLYPPQCAQASLYTGLLCVPTLAPKPSSIKSWKMNTEGLWRLAKCWQLRLLQLRCVFLYVVTCCVALKAASPRKPCRGPAALGGCQGTGHGLQPKRPKRRGFARLGLRHRYKREYRERERHVSIYKII